MALGQGRPDLHGRTIALGVVDDALAAVAGATGGRLLLVEGEAGIGKSRLLGEVADRAAAAGMAVAIGEADPLELGRPFGALIDAFGLTREDPDPTRARLGELLFADISNAGSVGDVQYLVQEALIALVERMTSESPLVLGLDDLQWADRATLATVVAISKRAADLPLLLICGTRPTPRPPELDQALGRMRDLGGEPVRLEPLPEDDVQALAAALLEANVGPGLRAQLDGCRGNPFFVIETIRSLQQEGALRERDGVIDVRSKTLPAPLRTSLLRRVETISPSAQEALRMAAVLGSTFSVEDLAALLQRPVPSVAAATHEAVRAGLLEDSGTTLAFRHDLIREALYEDLPRGIRSALHRDAARTLFDRAPTHVITQHLVLGAEPGDTEAVAWLQRAAADAGPRDPATAVDLLRRALDLEDPEAPGRPELHREYIDALAWAGHIDAALQEATTALGQTEDELDQVELRLAICRCCLLQGDSVGALNQLDQASKVTGLGDRHRARIAADFATARFAVYDIETTIREAGEAIEWGRKLDDRALETTGLAIRCRTLAMRGDFDEAVADGELAVQVAGDDPAALRALPHLYLGVALYDADRSGEAIATMREGLRRSEAIGAAWALSRQHNTLVAANFYAGAWDDALVEAEAGASLAAEVGSRAWQPQAQSIAGIIAFHRDDLDAARSSAEFARTDMDRPGGDAGGMGWVGLLEALLLEVDGDPKGAVARLTRPYDVSAQLGVGTMTHRLATHYVRMAVAAGETALAEEVAQEAERLATTVTAATYQGAAAYCRGLVSGDADVLVAAMDHYREVSPIDLIISARAAAEALDRAGRRDDARIALEEALAWCEKVGADRQGHAITARLEALAGSKAVPEYRDRPVSGWESLTPAEQNVATLVGEGLPNAEIAERLFISRRTVETHVGHLYQKLQVKGRVALAMEITAHT